MNDFGKMHRRQIILGGTDKPVNTWKTKPRNHHKVFILIVMALTGGWILATCIKTLVL